MLALAVLAGHPSLTLPVQAKSALTTSDSLHKHSAPSYQSRQLLQEDYDDEYLEDEFYEEDIAQPAGTGGGSTTATGANGTVAGANGTAPARVRRTNRTRKGTVSSKEVAFVPQVNVTFGDDIDDEGRFTA